MLKIKDPLKNERKTKCQKHQSNSFFSVNTKLQNIIKEAGLIAKNLCKKEPFSLMQYNDEKPW